MYSIIELYFGFVVKVGKERFKLMLCGNVGIDEDRYVVRI